MQISNTAVIASPTLFVFVGRGNPEKTQNIIPYAAGVLDCHARKSISLAMTGDKILSSGSALSIRFF
jgi:hypothetical protein